MLHMYHRPQLTQWDALYVQYGVAFYTLPKISPLQYLQGLLGSGIIVSAYLWLLVFVRPMPLMELALTVFYLVPSLYLFNHLAYATEKAARERWVPPHRLGTSRCTLRLLIAVVGTDLSPRATSHHAVLVRTGLRFDSGWARPTSAWTSAWRSRAARQRRYSRVSASAASCRCPARVSSDGCGRGRCWRGCCSRWQGGCPSRNLFASWISPPLWRG